MSTLKVNTVVDSSGGNTATVNGVTPSTHTVKGRNLIINGAMEIAQRATTFATAVTNGYHAIDRIRVMGSSNVGQWTISQDSDVPAGFNKSLKYECTTADTSLATNDHLGLGYFPEGYHMNPVSKGTSGAKSMTLSFYLKANVTKTLVVEVADGGNARHVTFAVTPSATNTWERITLSIPADTSGSFNQGTNSKAAEINFWLAAGTFYNSGSNQSTWTSRTAANIMAGTSNWADTVGNTIWITGLQLELGDVATEFDHKPYHEELALCQRYYERFGQGWWARFESGSTVVVNGQFKVEKRTAPTIGLPVGGTIRLYEWGVSDRDASPSLSSTAMAANGGHFKLSGFSVGGSTGEIWGVGGTPSNISNHPFDASSEL